MKKIDFFLPFFSSHYSLLFFLVHKRFRKKQPHTRNDRKLRTDASIFRRIACQKCGEGFEDLGNGCAGNLPSSPHLSIPDSGQRNRNGVFNLLQRVQHAFIQLTASKTIIGRPFQKVVRKPHKKTPPFFFVFLLLLFSLILLYRLIRKLHVSTAYNVVD